ncbi:hypothetical protein [Bacillus subtilis]|nr:hypothetical protein [Bacillus subtilis]POD88454.1 hypothetical protein S101384_01177 [Bacillus subtilis subsp. subtilis]
MSVADVDVSEITRGEETLWVDGRRMEASDFNGDIDEKDWGKDYDNH